MNRSSAQLQGPVCSLKFECIDYHDWFDSQKNVVLFRSGINICSFLTQDE